MKLLEARLDPARKGYNCLNCHELFTKNRMEPACMSGKCPVADVAPDVRLNKLLTAFFQVEQFDMFPGYATFQEQLIRESGLGEETPDTILAMKGVVADYRERQQQKAEGKRRR